MTQETETLALREYFRCRNREEGRNGTLRRRERKKEREFGLVESERLQEGSWGFEERQHCHLIFGLKTSIGQARKEKEK